MIPKSGSRFSDQIMPTLESVALRAKPPGLIKKKR
jgi:hypothetical protein